MTSRFIEVDSLALVRVDLRAVFVAFALLAAPANARDVPQRMRADVEKLVSFGTRHTLSSATHPTRGIGASRSWVAGEFRKLGLTVERPARRASGPRAPEGVMVENVLGIQPGSAPDEVVIIAGHIDSRVSDVMDATSDSPGANDDASGVSVVLEAARQLSKQKFRATVVYAALSGEEQGLWGGALLATIARERGWKVSAMLNNDIVGNTVGTDGRVVADRVRVFSEGIELAKDEKGLKAARQIGAEDDSPSRALAKRIEQVADGLIRQDDPRRNIEDSSLSVFLVRRPDRFGRGGDHTALLEAGYPAVRFSVGIENYDAQHQDLRTENGRHYGDTVDRMDFAYLAKVAALNIATLRQLADAPIAPATVTLDGAVSVDTRVSWTPSAGAAGYRIRWRRADAQDWQESRDVPGSATSELLEGIIVDDTFIGVSALSSSGAESLVTFGGLPARP